MASPEPNGRLSLGSCLVTSETKEDRNHKTAAESDELDKPGVATPPDKLGVHRAGVPAAEDAGAVAARLAKHKGTDIVGIAGIADGKAPSN